MRIELLHIPDCPHTAGTRQLLVACLAELGLADAVVDREGPYPSPTIRVNGEDVMGAPAGAEAACRLDVPTRDRILKALFRARSQQETSPAG